MRFNVQKTGKNKNKLKKEGEKRKIGEREECLRKECWDL
jgi:hypothetical protein